MTTVGSCSCQPGDPTCPSFSQFLHKYTNTNTQIQVHKYTNTALTTVGSCCQVTRHVPAFPGSNPAMPPLKPNHRTRSPPPPLQYLGAALAHGSRVAARRKARAPSHPTWAHTLVCALKLIHLCTSKHIHLCAHKHEHLINILSNVCKTPTHTCKCTLTIQRDDRIHW